MKRSPPPSAPSGREAPVFKISRPKSSHKYLCEANASAAARVEASIHASLSNLILFPLIGRQQTQPGVRKHVTPRYRYLIYYTYDDVTEIITIISVKHPAQKRPHDDA